MATTAKVAKSSSRGSKPGERRGGRKRGTPNKSTAELRELARNYTKRALDTLVQIATEGESEPARVAAANAILDRGYGKPSQVLAGDDDGGPISIISRVELIALDGNSTG